MSAVAMIKIAAIELVAAIFYAAFALPNGAPG